MKIMNGGPEGTGEEMSWKERLDARMADDQMLADSATWSRCAIGERIRELTEMSEGDLAYALWTPEVGKMISITRRAARLGVNFCDAVKNGDWEDAEEIREAISRLRTDEIMEAAE